MSRRALPPAALVLPLLLAACSDATGPGAVERIDELPRQLSAVEGAVLAASNAFAFDLSRELLPDAPDENLFWSPLSASMALGMLLNGADGETFEQIRGVLGFEGLSEPEINRGYRDLTDLLLGLDPTVTVEIGNSVWTGAGYPVRTDYVTRVADAFRAEAAEVDFGDPATLDRINRWASDATHGLIDPMFDSLDPWLVALLLNAVYFKGDWTTRFDEDRTRRAPFIRSDGSEVEVDLMYVATAVDVGHADGAALVDLPYGGEAFSMTVVLPTGDRTVSDLVGELDAPTWDRWLGSLAEVEDMRVQLPRFELTWERKLNEPLKALGMIDAFGAGRADLSRLGPGGAYVSFVKQKAFVNVDEKGTEAGAVTGVGVRVVSGPPTFRIDRPFLFVLRERLTGTILFMGVVNDPTA